MRPRQLTLDLDGLTVEIDTADSIIGPHLVKDGIWEPFEVSLFEDSITPGMVVVDIGANLGYYTLRAARAVGSQGRVIAFEPDTRNLVLLKRNIAANGFEDRVTVVSAAVSDKSGSIQLFCDDHNFGAHSTTRANANSTAAINVAAVTLDEALSDLDIDRVDVLKFDAQGAEGAIFAGATRVLSSRPLRAFVEFWPWGLRNAGTDPAVFLTSLSQTLGFSVSLLDPANERVVARPSLEHVMSECLGDSHVDLLLERQ